MARASSESAFVLTEHRAVVHVGENQLLIQVVRVVWITQRLDMESATTRE
jgi:hypothetical protein